MNRRLVTPLKPGMNKAHGAYFRGERAEIIVQKRVQGYAKEKEERKIRSAKKREAKKLGHDFIDLSKVDD